MRRKKNPAIFREVEKTMQEENDQRMRSAKPHFVIDKKPDVASNLVKSAEERKKTYAEKATVADRVLASNPLVPDVIIRTKVKRTLTPKQVAKNEENYKRAKRQRTEHYEKKKRRLQSYQIYGKEKHPRAFQMNSKTLKESSDQGPPK